MPTREQLNARSRRYTAPSSSRCSPSLTPTRYSSPAPATAAFPSRRLVPPSFRHAASYASPESLARDVAALPDAHVGQSPSSPLRSRPRPRMSFSGLELGGEDDDDEEDASPSLLPVTRPTARRYVSSAPNVSSLLLNRLSIVSYRMISLTDAKKKKHHIVHFTPAPLPAAIIPHACCSTSAAAAAASDPSRVRLYWRRPSECHGLGRPSQAAHPSSSPQRQCPSLSSTRIAKELERCCCEQNGIEPTITFPCCFQACTCSSSHHCSRCPSSSLLSLPALPPILSPPRSQAEIKAG